MGDIASPLQSIEAAIEQVKTRRNGADSDAPAVIWLREGRYAVSQAIAFSDPLLNNTTVAAYNNEQAEISATTVLSGFSECEINGVKALSLYTDLRFNTLYHPTRVITTPRYPETGNFTLKSVDHADDLFTAKTTYWESSRGNTSINADPSDIGLTFSQPEEIYCRITHGWLDEIARIRFYDEKTGKIGLGRPATYETKSGDVFWLENVREALDAPGEWYLDETLGMLYYVPFEGETPESVTLYAPVSEYLMEIDGCSNLTFDHIRFTGSEWTLAVPPDDGGVRSQYNIDAYQASTESEAAVNVQNADGITFKNCEFIDIGNTAIKFIKNCHDCTVENCIFRRIGSTALAVYGENVSPDAENAAEAMSGFHVINNLIERYGRNTYESVGVHMMYVCDSEVRHNEIHDGYYTGLSCGWIWGHEYQVTKNIQITDNLIYDIGQGWLSDLGGMYLLGEQEGTVIAGNVIYNVTRGQGANDYGGNGIYTDAGSSYFTIMQNLIYDCAATGINIGGYNRDHTVKNNIVAFCKLSAFDPGWGDQLPTDHTCDCTGNIFYADNAPVILDVSADAAYSENGNLLWDRTNGAAVFGSDGYSGDYANKLKINVKYAEKNGFFTQDVIADPMFIDPQTRNFELRADSPALNGGINFTPWDLSSAGLPDLEMIGCGSEWNRGDTARMNDLSAYENACGGHPLSYAALRQSEWVLPALILISMLGSFLCAVKWTKRDKNMPRLKKCIALICTPVMLMLMAPLYYSFVIKWQMYLYGICITLFVVFSVLPAILSRCRLWLRILCSVIAVGISMGLTFLLNNVLHLGEELALFAGISVLTGFSLICTWSLSRGKKEKRIKM